MADTETPEIRNRCEVAVNDRASVELSWYVRPKEGLWWWSRWEGRIELSWPNGHTEILWKRHYRKKAKAWAKTQRRFVEWIDANTVERLNSDGGDTHGN